MTEAAIETHGLTKCFGDFAAVADLDLEVRHGEIFGFLGPNGSGKTTTMRTLLDQLRATRGTAQILGLDIRRDSVEIRRHVGYLPGDLALYPKLTGRQTLDYFATLRGGVDPAYVAELAERFHADLTKKVRDLSTGNRQKLGLIQAFMHKPDLLILDEPNSGLDPLMQQESHALMDEVRGEGRTVFLSSHTLSEVDRVADRVGILRAGRLVVVERVDELKRKAIRRIDFEFDSAVPDTLFDGVPGVRTAEVRGRRAQISFDGSVNPLLRTALTQQLVDLHTRESDLEEIFLDYYREPGPQDAKADPDAG